MDLKRSEFTVAASGSIGLQLLFLALVAKKIAIALVQG